MDMLLGVSPAHCGKGKEREMIMHYKPKKYEKLYIRSMSKSFLVTAIFDNDKEANEFMEKNENQVVIACFGPLVFLADKYDQGI